MDKRLIIRGRDLIDILHDLSESNLVELTTTYYPCAAHHIFDGQRNLYSVFPSKVNYISRPEDMVTMHTTAISDDDTDFSIAFHSNKKVMLDLYFFVHTVDEQLAKKGHRPKPHLNDYWNTIVKDASSAMKIWKSAQGRAIFTEESETYKLWVNKRYCSILSEKEKIYLCTLLRFYTGVPDNALKNDFATTEPRRYRRKARNIVIPKLRAIFPDLPTLPCEAGNDEDD